MFYFCLLLITGGAELRRQGRLVPTFTLKISPLRGFIQLRKSSLPTYMTLFQPRWGHKCVFSPG